MKTSGSGSELRLQTVTSLDQKQDNSPKPSIKQAQIQTAQLQARLYSGSENLTKQTDAFQNFQAKEQKAPEGVPGVDDVKKSAPKASDKVVFVKTGDTLSHIAQRHNTTWPELAKYNNLDNPDLIFPGQRIRIPQEASVEPSPSAATNSQAPNVQTTAPSIKTPTVDESPVRPSMQEAPSINTQAPEAPSAEPQPQPKKTKPAPKQPKTPAQQPKQELSWWERAQNVAGNVAGHVSDFVEERVVEPTLDAAADVARAVDKHVIDPTVDFATDVASDVANAVDKHVIDPAKNLVSDARDFVEDRIIDPVTDRIEDIVDTGDTATHPVDRTHLNVADRAVLSALDLDDIAPGGSTELDVKLAAEVAAVVGVEAGTRGKLIIERDKDDPNKYKIGIGAEGYGEVTLSGDTAGAEANTALGVKGKAKIELTTDLSKEGAATELAAFGLHTAAVGSLPAPLAGAVLAVEEIPGVDLPGEPIEYMRDNLSAVELMGDFHSKTRLGAILGAGVTGKLYGYLEGGGRMEFHKDGTRRLILRGAAGGTLQANAGVGAGGIQGEVRVGNVNLEVGGEREIVFDKDWNEQSVHHRVTLDGSMMAAGVGVQVGGELDLESLTAQYPQASAEIRTALADGNFRRVGQIIQNDILPNQGVTLKGSLDGFVEARGQLKANIKEFGIGGKLMLEAGVRSIAPLTSGEITVNRDGLSFSGDIPPLGLEAGKTYSYQDIQDAFMVGTTLPFQ